MVFNKQGAENEDNADRIGRSSKERRSGARTPERKREIVLEMTWPPTNPILSRPLVNYPRGNSSGELVGKFDFAVMTIPGIGCRYGETFAIKHAARSDLEFSNVTRTSSVVA